METQFCTFIIIDVYKRQSYDNPEDVEIVFHDGGISLSVRNDASFIVDAHICSISHPR